MKKILLYSGLVLSLCITQIPGIFAQAVPENLRLKGKLSPNSENEDNEADPPFKGLGTPVGIQKKTGDQKHVSELENGLKIVKEIIDKLIEKEYNFSLLSQHKYMINSCLGFKVSAGEFSVKFKNPVIEVGNSGNIIIKLGLNKINLSALKIRMRPCAKPEHILDPCHFGKKFEIGGEATDVFVKATLDIVAHAFDGSAGVCYFALGDNLDFNWHIGDINLKPMQNNLDNLGKDMLEDGLNGGLFKLFYTKFIELSKEVIPQYYKECENAYNVEQKLKNVSSEIVGGNEKNNSNSGNETDKWVITPVKDMKGVLGRLNSTFPADVSWTMDIYTQADNKMVNLITSNHNIKTSSLSPGEYAIKFTGVQLQNVPVQKGHETRLKVGFLNIVSDGSWDLYDAAKENIHTSNTKPQKIALPVGSYQLKLGGNFYPVVIKDGETEEY